MDNRLVLVVLFVTLSWVSVGTYAQITAAPNMTTASESSMTTAVGNNMTSAMATNTSTAAGDNVTSAMATNMTTVAGNNMTSGPNATMATNMTTAAGNNTNNTSASLATAPATTTTATTTTATTTTTTTTTTTVTTVGNLESSVSNSDCGTGKLCAAEPASCNPSVAGSCFFLSAKQNNGQTFDFELSGESGGYLAATLSTDGTLGGNDTTYVCANNNGAVKFFGALLNNNQLTMTKLNVTTVRGSISGNRIQCTFAATVPTTLTRAANFAVGISTGPFNSTSGTLGSPEFKLRSPIINLQSTNSTVTNELANHAITFQLSLMQALLISLGVLGLSMQ